MRGGGLIAINLHGIGWPARPLEPGEAPYWISEAQYARLLDRIAMAPNRDRIRLTFDDGNASDLEIGLPGLQERGLSAAFFVLTDRLGRPGSLGEADLLALQEAGMTVGSHGAGHLDWSSLSPEVLEAEIGPPLDRLARVLGRRPDSVAVPFGRWSGRVLRTLGRAGVRTVWTSDGGPAREGAFLRPRTSVRGDMEEAAFDALVAGHWPLSRAVRRRLGMGRKWLLGP